MRFWVGLQVPATKQQRACRWQAFLYLVWLAWSREQRARNAADAVTLAAAASRVRSRSQRCAHFVAAERFCRWSWRQTHCANGRADRRTLSVPKQRSAALAGLGHSAGALNFWPAPRGASGRFFLQSVSLGLVGRSLPRHRFGASTANQPCAPAGAPHRDVCHVPIYRRHNALLLLHQFSPWRSWQKRGVGIFTSCLTQG